MGTRLWVPLAFTERMSHLGVGCMAALQAEHFLAAHEQLPDRVPERAIAEDDAETAKVLALQSVLLSLRIVST